MTRLVQEPSDEGRTAPLEDVEHPAFEPTAAVDAQHANAHPVAVHDGTHLVLAEVDRPLAVVAPDESVSVAVAFDGAVELPEQAARGFC